MPDVIQIAIEAIDHASSVIGVVGKSLDKMGGQADSADKKMKLFGLSADQIGAKMTQAGKIATVGLTLPIAGLAVAATKAASDLNETGNKIDTLFGNASDEVKKFADTAATALGQSKKQALDAAADFAVFGKAAGLAGDDLVKFSEKNVTLAADMASFFNTSPEEAITAIGAAFRGESEPIRRYGVLINEASLKDEALRMGLIKTTTEALQPQARVLAAQALILKQTSAAQGDFAKTSGGLANQSRILNAQFQDTLSTLGQSLLPVAVKMTGAANDLLKSFNDLAPAQRDVVVAFGLMAAAAGPVLTIGGKLVGVFGSLGSIAIDSTRGLISVGKTIGETAGYIKDAGISADSLKFAFQNLQAGGVVLGVELGVISAGLVAITKFIVEAGKAADATTDELLKMASSGDFFSQAGASFEIVVNGQNRLNIAVQGVEKQLRSANKTYDDYIAGVLGAAVAAGTITKAQADEYISTGKVTDEFYHQIDVTQRVIDQTGIMTRANYELRDSQNKIIPLYGDLEKAIGRTGFIVSSAIKTTIAQTAANNEYVPSARSVIDSTIETARAQRDQTSAAKAMQEVEKEVEQTLKDEFDARKFYNKQISDTTTIAIQFTEAQRDQAKVQDELDKLNEKIAARGPARTVSIKNETLSAEELATAQLKLAAAQEDLSTVQRKGGETDAEFALRVDTIKGKIVDYSAKLGEHTAIVGGATKAELEQKTALEGQIAAIQKSVEVQRAKGAFDSLTKSFEDGALTQAQYTERMTALNAITGMYTAEALTQAVAQETLMKAFADPRSEAWRSQLILNQKEIDGVIEKTDAATEATNNLKTAQAQPVKAETKAAEVELPTAGKSIEAAQAALDFQNRNKEASDAAKKSVEELSVAQEKASREMKGNIDQVVGAYGKIPTEVTTKVKTVIEEAQGVAGDSFKERFKQLPSTVTTKVGVDTAQASKDIQSYTTDKVGGIPKEKKTTAIFDTYKATNDTNSLLRLFGSIPATKNTAVNVDGKIALQTLDDILKGLNDLYSKTVTVTVKYATQGTPPVGLQHGGSYVVPPNPSGSNRDYFPVLAAAGERVTVTPRAEQKAGGDQRSGDTYNYTTNVYNPLAAAMLADKQRRDRIARSNSRMGVNV